jgi:hypothetical protein
MGIWIWCIAAILVILGSAAGYEKQIREGNEALVERFGRYHHKLLPGVNEGILPFVDKIVVEVSVKEQILEIQAHQTTTKDSIRLALDAMIFWRIYDLKKAWYEIQDVQVALKAMIIGTLSNQISQLTLEEVKSTHQQIVSSTLEAISEPFYSWGVTVSRFNFNIMVAASVDSSENIISLAFSNGVNLVALKHSFSVVFEEQHVELKIHDVFHNSDGVLVVQIKVPPEVDRAEVEVFIKKEYEEFIKSLDDQKVSLISNILNEISTAIKTMSEHSKYNFPNAQKVQIFEQVDKYVENSTVVEFDTRSALDDLKQVITELQQRYPQVDTEQASIIIDAEFQEMKRTQPQRWQKLFSLKRVLNGAKKSSLKVGEHFAEETVWGKAIVGFLEGVTDDTV